MKRSALLFSALMVGVAGAANAQGLTMQMGNGWNFSFAGNVNIFAMYQKVSDSGEFNVDLDGDGFVDNSAPGGIVGVGGKGLYYGTGLLPAFATFTASGKEGNTDLGAHFGFAPQVQCGGNHCLYAHIRIQCVLPHHLQRWSPKASSYPPESHQSTRGTAFGKALAPAM